MIRKRKHADTHVSVKPFKEILFYLNRLALSTFDYKKLFGQEGFACLYLQPTYMLTTERDNGCMARKLSRQSSNNFIYYSLPYGKQVRNTEEVKSSESCKLHGIPR